ncbi:odorant receptor 13a-like [Formica exsecta]|uniref:odorant receptor 13a-like n=1 Tax=Formica exsecta TaxID=72781 RepID=UPI001143CA18|nr:odorant receptor 13a-like [Formica exsecta]
MTTKSIVIMIVMLLQSFLYSYAGDNLRDQSEALSFADYDSNCIYDRTICIKAFPFYQGNDCLFFNITLYVCGQVEILKTRFVNFDNTESEIYERCNALIQRHTYLTRMARELADTISFVLLIQLFIITIQLCITGFQFILVLKVNDAGKSLMVQFTFLSQLTLYSFIGDYLKSQMEEVGLSIYQNACYNFPTKLTKNLIFVIMRTQYPVALYAANFVVNLSTYMSILKASISYLSVLRVMIET